MSELGVRHGVDLLRWLMYIGHKWVVLGSIRCDGSSEVPMLSWMAGQIVLSYGLRTTSKVPFFVWNTALDCYLTADNL